MTQDSREVTTVLVVEDDPMWQRLVRHTLGKHDVDIVVAPTLVDAVDHLRRRAVDLVVADYELPDGLGLELFDAVDRGHLGRFVLATGYSDPEDLDDPRASLVDRFLTKPFLSSELSACLDGLVRAPAGPSQA